MNSSRNSESTKRWISKKLNLSYLVTRVKNLVLYFIYLCFSIIWKVICTIFSLCKKFCLILFDVITIYFIEILLFIFLSPNVRSALKSFVQYFSSPLSEFLIFTTNILMKLFFSVYLTIPLLNSAVLLMLLLLWVFNPLFISLLLNFCFKFLVNGEERHPEYETALRRLETLLEIERDERTCVVCKDGLKNVVFRPCKHFCTCYRCWKILKLSSKSCPLCRQRVASYVKVYL